MESMDQYSSADSNLGKIFQPDVLQKNLNKTSRGKFIQFLNDAIDESAYEYYLSTYRFLRDTIKYFTECQQLNGSIYFVSVL